MINMAFKKSLELMTTVFFWTVCMVGFIFQSFKMCEIYFKYKTSNNIKLEILDKITTPSVSVCVRYVDILDRTNHEQYSLNETFYDENVERESSLLTIKQIFDLTPVPNETISGCVIRPRDNLLMMENLTRQDCNNLIDSNKFYMQEYVCYRYSMRWNQTIDIIRVSQSLHYPRVAYNINLQHFATAGIIYIIIDPEPHGFPEYSRQFGQIGRRFYKGDNYFSMRYQYTQIKRLKPPYETNCAYTEEDSMECKKACLLRSLNETLQRVPFSEIIDLPHDLKHVNSDDISNETRREMIHNITKHCKSKCTRPPCELRFATTLLYSRSSEPQNLTTIQVLIPYGSSATIKSYPNVDLRELFLYLWSTFAFWFGLSISSLNPAAIQQIISTYILKINRRDNQQSPLQHRLPRDHHLIREISRLRGDINYLMREVIRNSSLNNYLLIEITRRNR